MEEVNLSVIFPIIFIIILLSVFLAYSLSKLSCEKICEIKGMVSNFSIIKGCSCFKFVCENNTCEAIYG